MDASPALAVAPALPCQSATGAPTPTHIRTPSHLGRRPWPTGVLPGPPQRLIRTSRVGLLLAAASLLLAGCGLAPRQPMATVPDAAVAPARFHDPGPPVDGSAARQPAQGRWWQLFQDPALDRLIDQADRHSPTLQQAQARARQAQALLAGAVAQGRPLLSLDGGVSRQGGPVLANNRADRGEGTALNLGLNLAWEVDLLGRQALLRDAARLDQQASQSQVDATRLLVQAQVAQAYLSLRGLDDEARLLQDAHDSLQATLAVQDSRLRAGLVAARDVARLRVERNTLAAEQLDLARRRGLLLNGLVLLAGTHAADVDLPDGRLPALLPQVPAGLPSAMLARRADIAASQQTLQAVALQRQAADDAWLPALQLTATGGQVSSQLAGFLAAAGRGWGLLALLGVPLLDGGRQDAARAKAAADLELAAAQHREQVLVALREVEDQLTSLRLLARQAQLASDTAELAAQAHALVMASQQRGLASQLEVLDAQRTWLRERRAVVQLATARALATLALVRALGGGWDNPASAGKGGLAPTRKVGLASARRVGLASARRVGLASTRRVGSASTRKVGSASTRRVGLASTRKVGSAATVTAGAAAAGRAGAVSPTQAGVLSATATAGSPLSPAPSGQRVGAC